MEVPKQVWTSSIGMALALGVMLIAGVVTTALPCYDLGGTWYEEWYGRRWGSFGTLLFCLCAAGIGFAHVSTANCGRPWARAWVGRDGTLRDALRTALWTCVMWALSLNFALRDGCGSEAGRSEERLASVRFNFVYFCLPFVVGLQFTWLDVPALQGVMLTAAAIKSWGFFQWCVVVPTTVVVLAAVAYEMVLLSGVGRLWLYAAAAALVVGGVAVAGKALRATHYLHIHHYALFGMLLPFIAVESRVSSLCAGIVAGAALEGVSRWGMAPILERRRRALSTSATRGAEDAADTQLRMEEQGDDLGEGGGGGSADGAGARGDSEHGVLASGGAAAESSGSHQVEGRRGKPPSASVRVAVSADVPSAAPATVDGGFDSDSEARVGAAAADGPGSGRRSIASAGAGMLAALGGSAVHAHHAASMADG